VREADALVYRFKLAAGSPLAPGSYVFTAKYAVTEDRDARADTYRITGTTAGRPAGIDLSGGFG